MTPLWQNSPARWFGVLALGGAALIHPAAAQPSNAGADSPAALSEQFTGEVDHRLEVPVGDQQRYLSMLEKALSEATLSDLPAQAFVVVDRSPQVQAAFVVVRTQGGGWQWIGAAAVSTGKTGTFEHFLTPLGVFPHTLDNPDFRAEGTFNKNHIRGYGVRGRRVFDFGWQTAVRGWGAGGTSKMRLQMHATDPTTLEPRLGRVASEGCIRIPATLNVFLDRHGILDADYEQAMAGGKVFWVLDGPPRRVLWPGRYLVIIDSEASERPPWSPLPGVKPAPKSVPPARQDSQAPEG